MELGDFVTKGHQFSRNDRRINKQLRNNYRKDVVARAVRCANTTIMTGETMVRDFNQKDPLLYHGNEVRVPQPHQLSKGWGRQCKHIDGGTYGRKCIADYKDIIQELYDKGKNHLADKMNPVMMRQYLLQQYPNTYSLPGETEIKQQINVFVQNEKL